MKNVRSNQSCISMSFYTKFTKFAKLLDYKEKEETMRRRYKLKDTTYSVREDLSKETVETCKKLWDQVKK